MITNRKGDVSEDFCRYVCYTTLKGLDYLHSKNIMHRDIKSENIMISPRFDLKLCGFQFAEKLSKNREKRNKRVGTVDWMSPEMLNYKEYNITVDVWSFGILVFELTTGAPPYVDENRYTVIEKIISEPAPKLIDYSKKWSHDFCHFLKSLQLTHLPASRRQRFSQSQSCKRIFITSNAATELLQTT